MFEFLAFADQASTVEDDDQRAGSVHRGGQGWLGKPVAEGRGARRCGARVVPKFHRPGRGSLFGSGQDAGRASRRGRHRLRAGREPGHGPRTDGRRGGVWIISGVDGQDHVEGRAGRTVEFS